jgi:hypothetical protein
VTRDILAIIEAAYAEAVDPDAWLRGALEAIHPHLDQGTGVLAHRFAHRPDDFWRGPILAIGPDGDLGPVLDRLMRGRADGTLRRADLPLLRKVYPRAPVVSWVNCLVGQGWTQELANELAALSAATRQRLMAAPDSLGVIGGDPSGDGCIFFARGAGARLLRQTEALWRCIAAHLVTGHRLARGRRRDPDAVLSPAGRMLHREGDVIAYQLGLSPSAVGESLLRARKKLGARSRLDLVAAYLAERERREP